MTGWVVFTVAGLGTYLSRSFFILIVGDRVLSARAERALRNIGPAVLAALTASLLTTGGLVEFVTSITEVAAVLAALAAGLWRRTFAAAFVAAIIVWSGLSIVL